MPKKNKLPLIDLKEITKSYYLGNQEFPILHGISLRINQGEFVCLMGPSGSGKSTLMNIIGCLDTPDDGKYFLDQENVAKLNKDQLADIRNKYIGFIFQNFNLLPKQSALKNVSLPSFYAGEENLNKSRQLLKRVGLEERINNKPSEMSGGQRQRVAIARALMNDPKLILADEPTGNLDSKSAKDVMEILKQLNEKEGKTILLVTHDKLTSKFAKRMVRLKDGKLV
ncbi:MAG: ABC transporter ATP-binding protein [Patescibacteria group bacterium]